MILGRITLFLRLFCLEPLITELTLLGWPFTTCVLALSFKILSKVEIEPTVPLTSLVNALVSTLSCREGSTLF